MKKSKIVGISLGLVALTGVTIATPFIVTSCSSDNTNENNGSSSNNGNSSNGGSSSNKPSNPIKELPFGDKDLDKLKNRISKTLKAVKEEHFKKALWNTTQKKEIITEFFKDIRIANFTPSVISNVVVMTNPLTKMLQVTLVPANGYKFTKKVENLSTKIPTQIIFSHDQITVTGSLSFGKQTKIPLGIMQLNKIESNAKNAVKNMKFNDVNTAANQKKLKSAISKGTNIEPNMIWKITSRIFDTGSYGITVYSESTDYLFVKPSIFSKAGPTASVSKDNKSIDIENLKFADK